MKNRRSILVLSLAIILLAVAHLAVRTYDGENRLERRLSLVDRETPVDSLKIERRGHVAVVLCRTEETGWRIVEPFAGRADGQAVARALDVLSQTPIDDAVAERDLVRLGRTLADFALTDPVVKVTVGTGKERESVSFGMPTPTASGVYASVSGVGAVFVVPSEVLAAVDCPTETFRSRTVFSSGAESVSSFALRQGTGTNLSFVREKDVWKVDGEIASKTRVEQFLAELLSVEAVGFVWPVGVSNEAERISTSLLAGYGLEPENAVTVTLKDIDGSDRQLSLGRSADQGLVYASVQNGSVVVTVKDSLKTAALQKKSDFTDSRLFPVEEATVGFFRLVDGENSYVLARSEDGTWRLESPVAAPAEQTVVRRILSRLLQLSSSFAAGNRGDFSVSVSADTAPVCVLRDLVLGSDRLDDLRSLEMMRVEPRTVRRLVRTPGEKGARPAAVVRSREEDSWVVEVADGLSVASPTEIKTVLDALNPLVALRVEKLKVSAADLDGYGLGTPFLTLAVDLDRENAVRRNILIGAKTKGGRFATIGSADAVFVISEKTVDQLSSKLVGKSAD